jgi:hypothetical protein
MTLHLCQGPRCHTYETQSRLRGPKGNKVLRTRKARFNMNVNRDWIYDWEHYFCDNRCLQDWLKDHITNLINYVGLKTRPSETPVDIITETRRDWADREYISTTIKLLNEQSNDDTVTA